MPVEGRPVQTIDLKFPQAKPGEAEYHELGTFLQILRVDPCIRSLDLSNSPIDEQIAGLMVFLPQSGVEELCLAGCGIDIKGSRDKRPSSFIP
ncbi:MAG: hypothetical protein ACRYGK_13520 [Janthinobacterium lividum]